MPTNTAEDAQMIRDLMTRVGNSVASGPRIGKATMLSLKLMSEALSSEVFGGQIVLTIPPDTTKPIDVAFATSNLPIRAVP